MLVTALLAWIALLLPFRDQWQSPALQLGQVADQDYRAPRSITYTSEILTEQRLQEAEKSILPVYTMPDTNIARRQSEKLRAALTYITNVRLDSYATPVQKVVDLGAMDAVSLDQNISLEILGLSEARWQAVAQEANMTLERVMTGIIRPDTLEEALTRVPRLVSLSLSEDEAKISSILASAFIAPNSFFSQELTDSARQAARETISPVTRSFVAGQMLVSTGDVLTEVDLEALEALDLVDPALRWQQPVSAAILVLAMTFYILLYFRRRPALLGRPRRLTFIAALFIVFLFAVRLVVPFHAIIPYAFPLASFCLVVAALFGTDLAMVTSLPLSIMAAFALPNSLDLTLFYLVGGLLGILALGRARNMVSFFGAGLALAVGGAMMILALRLPQPSTDLVGLATLTGVSFFNGLATASLTILLQFFLAQLLSMTTPMQLMDLSRSDHPLLQLILRQAPGTYQHSLQVANLAEQAAERIGADALLTRVGSLYHDAGKAANPLFFIENQLPGTTSPHENLDPAESARIIIQHVANGLAFGRKYRLPRRLLDFIVEHHGTTSTRYQYVMAVKMAGGDESKVDQAAFRYPGPRPQSRETAILMLADGSEARVRAERPAGEDELHKLIKTVIEDRVAAGQLDHSRLTLQDLNEISESFFATLRGVYHPRVIYPQLDTPASADIITRPSSLSERKKAAQNPEPAALPPVQAENSAAADANPGP